MDISFDPFNFAVAVIGTVCTVITTSMQIIQFRRQLRDAVSYASVL